MDSVIKARIENSLTATLASAIEDAIASAIETHLEIEEFDLHYEASEDALGLLTGDVEELAAALADSIGDTVANYVADKEAEINERYEDECLPWVKKAYEQDGDVDGTARAEAYSKFVDGLNRDGEIGEYLASNIDLDVESL